MQKFLKVINFDIGNNSWLEKVLSQRFFNHVRPKITKKGRLWSITVCNFVLCSLYLSFKLVTYTVCIVRPVW